MVLAEGAQGLPGAIHQQVEGDALMLPGNGPEFGGQGEGHQEVVAGHQPLGLPLQPALALKVLAMRATAVSAGVRHHQLLLAAGTLRQHAGSHAGAAARHGVQCFAVAGQHGLVILRQEGRSEALDEGCQRDHFTAPQPMQKRAIKASMRASACSWVCVVRCV